MKSSDPLKKFMREFEKDKKRRARERAKLLAVQESIDSIRTIALNARRARFIVDHWEDEQGLPNLDISFEVGCVRKKIEDLTTERPEFGAGFAELHEEVAKKEFWENLAENMVGTQFEACGLSFKKFTYDSSLKPLWELEVSEPLPVEEAPFAGSSPLPPPSPPSAPVPLRRERRRRFQPMGCLGRLIKLIAKLLVRLLLLAWLGWYASKLWHAPAGDTPKLEVEATTGAGQKPVTEAEAKKGAGARDGTLAVGTRVVAKKVVPVYRLNAEKKPVVAGRVPPGGVLEVTGVVNAKVVRVSVALPNGKTAKGMAEVADLE